MDGEGQYPYHMLILTTPWASTHEIKNLEFGCTLITNQQMNLKTIKILREVNYNLEIRDFSVVFQPFKTIDEAVEMETKPYFH